MICLKNRTFAVSQTTIDKQKTWFSQLWFAWKIVLLQYRKQPYFSEYTTHQSCDLLEKSYFCSIANNHDIPTFTATTVVICLKNRTFAVSQTTSFNSSNLSSLLWFAWKIVLLQYRKQHTRPHGHASPCCDLLEKSYFCSIANNKTLLFLKFEQLWFAWKIVLLQYRKQQYPGNAGYERRCDLLEKSYFCSIANNFIIFFVSGLHVVICLKNRTFAVSQTTRWWQTCGRELLWFAWKIVLLQYRKQLGYLLGRLALGCDLLEKSYFCSIANNWISLKMAIHLVVICLKNRTFAVSQTTHEGSLSLYVCCDLLEKSYFCSIANNSSAIGNLSVLVVICLKNRTFAVSQTTS